MLKFLHKEVKERGMKGLSRKRRPRKVRFQTSDLRPQTPKLQTPQIFFKNIFTLETRLNSYHLMVYGDAMFIGNSQKEAKYLSSPVYRCCIEQTVKI